MLLAVPSKPPSQPASVTTRTTTMTATSLCSRRAGLVAVLACCGAALALLAGEADAKVYGRCDLAKALRNKGVALKDVPTWVCISEKLSSIDTATATDPDNDVDGTVYHGLFLISEKWWCNRGSAGCGVTCDQMKRTLESNIDCAKKVFVETKRLKGNGFRAWAAYEDCKEDDPNTQTYIEMCTGLEEDADEELDLTVFQRSGIPKDEYRHRPRHSDGGVESVGQVRPAGKQQQQQQRQLGVLGRERLHRQQDVAVHQVGGLVRGAGGGGPGPALAEGLRPRPAAHPARRVVGPRPAQEGERGHHALQDRHPGRRHRRPQRPPGPVAEPHQAPGERRLHLRHEHRLPRQGGQVLAQGLQLEAARGVPQLAAAVQDQHRRPQHPLHPRQAQERAGRHQGAPLALHARLARLGARAVRVHPAAHHPQEGLQLRVRSDRALAARLRLLGRRGAARPRRRAGGRRHAPAHGARRLPEVVPAGRRLGLRHRHPHGHPLPQPHPRCAHEHVRGHAPLHAGALHPGLHLPPAGGGPSVPGPPLPPVQDLLAAARGVRLLPPPGHQARHRRRCPARLARRPGRLHPGEVRRLDQQGVQVPERRRHREEVRPDRPAGQRHDLLGDGLHHHLHEAVLRVLHQRSAGHGHGQDPRQRAHGLHGHAARAVLHAQGGAPAQVPPAGALRPPQGGRPLPGLRGARHVRRRRLGRHEQDRQRADPQRSVIFVLFCLYCK